MALQVSTVVVAHSSRCTPSLLTRTLLRTLRKRPPFSPNTVFLFAFAPSLSTPPEVLSDITSALTQLYPEHVGCISATLPYRYPGRGFLGGPSSCSLAYAFVNGVSFRSTIPGHVKTQVGRWHAARERSGDQDVAQNDVESRIIDEHFQLDSQVNWEGIWDGTVKLPAGTQPQHEHSLKLLDGLQNLEPSTIDNIISFSDQTPEGLATVLEKAFPQANKLSLIASSTPFITGRPVTLFHNGSIFSSGAVGVVMESSPPPIVELSFPSLVALSGNLNITSSEGNMILSIESGNPTQLLLNAVRKHGLSSHTWVGKEDEFYIGVVDSSSQQVSRLHRINAGDPARGSIALDATSAPKAGCNVRLYHLPGNSGANTPTYVPDINSNKISLFVSPEVTAAESTPNEIMSSGLAEMDNLVVENAFLAASENGFSLSRGVHGPWTCVVPGARAALSWSRSIASQSV